jgi:hypothetical protein
LGVKLSTPSEFFGVEPGSDRTMIRWDRIVEYFWYLSKSSDRIIVEDKGKSTEGNPMILAYISSPENIKNREKIRTESWTISHPLNVSEKELNRIISKGKTVVGLTMSIHASEVGGTQVSPELAYEILTGEDELTRQIRENVMILLYPCANPDGQIMTTDWYRKYLGTEFEGGNMPWLYHKYAGHDNNRDALTLTQIETQIMNKTFLGEWFPQAYLDTHQMGFFGSRFFIPPNANPVDEVVDPLVWVEQKHYGAQMAIRMESNLSIGVESAASFPAEFMPGFSLVFPWFGITGMFTESASVKVATPVYVHHHQLTGTPRGRPEYKTQVNFLHPWKGGWWHLHDIMKGQKTAILATLEVAANNREMILGNMLQKARRAAEQGTSEPPYAFIITPDQWDGVTALKFLKTLRELSVEVHLAEEPFTIGDATYPEGSFIIFTGQTARAFIISLLDRSYYRDSLWVRTSDGTPLVNYDFATQTMAEFKGVNLVRCDQPLKGEFIKLNEIPPLEGSVETSKYGWLLDSRLNESFKAVNLLYKRKVKVNRVDEPTIIRGKETPAGSWYIPPGKTAEKVINDIAKETGLIFHSVEEKPAFKNHESPKLRVAVYQRYMGGNMDEGWTRWLLEQYCFEYTTVRDIDIKNGLKDKFDILILPSDATPMITGEKLEEYYEKRFKNTMTMPVYPPEYMSGIKTEGITKIKEFVEAGGTLLCLNESIDFAIEQLKVPVANLLKDLKPNQFHCPGSTLRVNFDNQHPLGYGMPENGLLVLKGSMALTVKQGPENDRFNLIATYPEDHIMQSGWLIGEEHLARRAAMVEAKMKKGRVILYAFQPQCRALTDATFKLFFNALVS